MPHRNFRYFSRRRILLLYLTAFLVLASVLAVVYLIAQSSENSQYEETRGTMSEGFAEPVTVEYQGEKYVKKQNATSLLLIGVDKADDTPSYGFRQGGQADFLLLAVADHDAKTVDLLQIDRDTMAEITVLGVLGNVVGTRNMQICLAHSFGANEEERCVNTVNSIAKLFQDVKIDGYFSMKINEINFLNDCLAGVTVTLQDDLSYIDPEMTVGTTLTLQGEQAEAFLRSRTAVGDGTNEARMRRQTAYLDAAIKKIKESGAADQSFFKAFFEQMGNRVTTNLTQGRVINEVYRISQYEGMGIDTLKGIHSIGQDGFVEFHADEDGLLTWIMGAFYNKTEGK